VPTFLLWRRMKLWELRSYEQVIKLEQERLVYQARLRSRFGRAWRRKAPVESLMPLRLAKYGVPLADTAPAGLAAAGIEPALLPPAPEPAAAAGSRAAGPAQVPSGEPRLELEPERRAEEPSNPWLHARDPQSVEYHGDYDPDFDPDEYARWMADQRQAEQYEDQYQEEPPLREPAPEETGAFPIPVIPGGRTRELGEGGAAPDAEPDEEAYYQVFKKSINGSYPTPREFGDNVEAEFSRTLPPEEAKRMVTRFTNRFNAELEEDHIA
jgi:hypothetical protein